MGPCYRDVSSIGRGMDVFRARNFTMEVAVILDGILDIIIQFTGDKTNKNGYCGKETQVSISIHKMIREVIKTL